MEYLLFPWFQKTMYIQIIIHCHNKRKCNTKTIISLNLQGSLLKDDMCKVAQLKIDLFSIKMWIIL